MAPSTASSPSQIFQADDPAKEQPHLEDTEQVPMDTTDALDPAAVSPKTKVTMLNIGLSSSPEAQIAQLNDLKDISAIPSTYVSPTFHILDPYSYRLPSIAESREALTPASQAYAQCKYPVLQYLSPFLDKEFGSGLACDLLDTYFSSAYLSRMHPTCHHIHNFILRKADVLHPHQPRQTHPALLGSMLFVAVRPTAQPIIPVLLIRMTGF
jgi:hypothetical protein